MTPSLLWALPSQEGQSGPTGVIPTGVDDDSPAVPSRHGLRRQAIHDFLVAERKTWMPTCVGMTVCGGPACQPFRGLVLYRDAIDILLVYAGNLRFNTIDDQTEEIV